MSAKREGDKIVTMFKVKNISATGSIIGLQIDQFFYDKPAIRSRAPATVSA